MNQLLFILLNIIHILVWLVVIFGRFISYNITKLNMLIIIPLIYIIHLLPFHIFLKKKFNEIHDDFDNQYTLYKNDIEKYSDEYLLLFQDAYSSLPKHIPKERRNIIIKIYFVHEDKYIFPKIYKNIRVKFANSFANPLSPQGMLILGYIMSSIALFFKWKKII